jgi:phenylacetate-CoA ligase
MRHAHRTAGFFRIRGININHAEFEDFVFRMVDVNDFKVKLCTKQDRELLKLMIELNRAADLAVAASKLRTAFEVRPTVEISIPGMPRNRVDFGGLAANSGDSNLNMSFSRIPL